MSLQTDWEPMVYRNLVGPPKKIFHWPHEGYWTVVTGGVNGEVVKEHGRFATAEEAANAEQQNNLQ